MRRKLKRFGLFAGITMLVIVIAAAIALYLMGLRDKEHARFFNAGKSVNGFLSDYNHALKHAFQTHDPSGVATSYSDSYRSPHRGRWLMKRDADQGDIGCYSVVVDGAQDFS